MMKRVGLSRFSPLVMSRKVQQCLRFEGVNNTNGVSDSDVDFCPEVSKETEDVPSNDELSAKHPSDRRIKSNLLTTIKKKLKKSKRNKRSDVHSNMCQCHSENCEMNGNFSKHFRSRKQKCCDKNIWPVSSSILRCQNHQDPKSDDVAELISSFADENEECSCYIPTSKSSNCCKIDVMPSCSKFPPRTSCSLSDVSCTKDSNDTSLSVKVESEGDVRKLYILDPNGLDNSHTYAICPMHNNNNDVTCHAKEPVVAVVPRVGNLTMELHKLSKYGWYWGPITRSEAESKLIDQPDGAFLVRDSSDDRYILSLSFRSHRKTFHTRIEHSNGLFSFYSQPEPGGHASIVELIQQSMYLSQSGVFCYSRSRSPGAPSIPVRLMKPISRFTQVRSLQYLCRFIIRQYTRYDHLQKLPLPPRIRGYLEEGHY